MRHSCLVPKPYHGSCLQVHEIRCRLQLYYRIAMRQCTLLYGRGFCCGSSLEHVHSQLQEVGVLAIATSRHASQLIWSLEQPPACAECTRVRMPLIRDGGHLCIAFLFHASSWRYYAHRFERSGTCHYSTNAHDFGFDDTRVRKINVCQQAEWLMLS